MTALNHAAHNLDVLSCIANLSNDEVFTPPHLVTKILDDLELAWEADHPGERIWENPEVKFLDPASKSGVFLREITRRLSSGLAQLIPDLQERVNHILANQVYGISITEITALLTRRSVYCSKTANGNHSVCTAFDDSDGNIRFKRTEHTWAGGKRQAILDPLSLEEKWQRVGRKCLYCGAGEEEYNRGVGFETHAYEFIHTDNIKDQLKYIFGEEMHFDVVIGNPPYQLGSNGGTRDVPIYQKFVAQAKALEPNYLTMIIPARWMSTGLGLNEFRAEMLNDSRIRTLVDYPDSQEIFDGVDIKGGVCYFLWDSTYDDRCEFMQVRNGDSTTSQKRMLNEHDVLVRDIKGLEILRKILTHEETSVQTILSSDKQFGWTSNFAGLSTLQSDDSVPVYCYQDRKRQIKYISRSEVTKSPELLPYWKLLVPKAASDGGRTIPDVVLGKPWIAEAGSACTQTFLFFRFNSEAETESFESYYKTRFFRFLVSLRKTTQDATNSTYRWVPMQKWDRIWTDEELFSKYKITPEESEYIETMIKAMDGDAK